MEIDVLKLLELIQAKNNREPMMKAMLGLELRGNLQLLRAVNFEDVPDTDDEVEAYSTVAKLLTVDSTVAVLGACETKKGLFSTMIEFVDDEVDPQVGRTETRSIKDALKFICGSIRTLAKLDYIDRSVLRNVNPRTRLQNLEQNIVAVLRVIENWKTTAAPKPEASLEN